MGSGTHSGRWCLGTPGRLSCLAFSLAVAILARGWWVALACGLVLALALAFCRAGLRYLRSPRLWLFVGFLLVPAALWGGPPDWRVGWLALSGAGLAAGGQMALRALAIVVGVAGFAATVSVSELAGLLERAGLKGLGFALGVAFNMLPVIEESLTNAYQALRMRGGFRRQRLRALRLLLVTVVAGSLRHADDIVSAADARAFSIDRARPLPVRWQRGDLALMGVLAAVAVALILV
jgi:energy-coupling factor transporter transmembrane protein EcfT